MKDVFLSQLGKKAFGTVDGGRGVIKPYPGRYPTRWRLSFVDGEKNLVFSYRGKPNPLLRLKVARLLKQPGYLLLQEFDQLGCFRECAKATPRHDTNLTDYNGVACYTFYPWQVSTGRFFEPWEVESFPTRIYWGKGRKRRSLGFYSPFKDTVNNDAGLQRCREFHAWLRKSNVYR